jgi:tyrosyl-tRNA synthetase
MQAKKDLAAKIVTDFHSAEAAKRASDDWAKQFQKDEVPEQVQVIHLKYSDVGPPDKNGQSGTENPARLDRLLLRCGLAESATDGQRKIKQKAVKLGGTVVPRPLFVITSFPFEAVVQVGRQVRRIVITA